MSGYRNCQDIRPYIIPAVCHIINLSIQSKKFPTKWKIARVIPLYKGNGSKFNPKNYIPVACYEQSIGESHVLCTTRSLPIWTEINYSIQVTMHIGPSTLPPLL